MTENHSESETAVRENAYHNTNHEQTSCYPHIVYASHCLSLRYSLFVEGALFVIKFIQHNSLKRSMDFQKSIMISKSRIIKIQKKYKAIASNLKRKLNKRTKFGRKK